VFKVKAVYVTTWNKKKRKEEKLVIVDRWSKRPDWDPGKSKDCETFDPHIRKWFSLCNHRSSIDATVRIGLLILKRILQNT